MTFSTLDSALTGELFATDAMRTVFEDRSRLAAMLEAESALARAQTRFGLAPEGLAAAIAAIDVGSLDVAALGHATAVAGVPVIPFVKAVQARLPAGSEAFFHRGATTQDILDTASALQIGEAVGIVAGELGAILESLAALADRHRASLCAGRTYGQHAAPVTFGYKAAIWLAGLTEAAERLPEVRARACVASLGGPVGTLAGLGEHGPAVLEAFAEELSLRAPPLSWHTRRAAMAELGSWLAILIGALAKMATDVAHLASTEVGEVAEPHGPGRGGSSAMPHKRNPVSSTLILAAHAAARGPAGLLIEAMAAAHERPAGLWHAEWGALPQLFGLASGALREGRALAEGLAVDTARMRRNLDLTRGLLFADAASALLAPHLGREAAHALVERAAEAVRDDGVGLQEMLDGMAETEGFDLTPAFDPAPAIAAAGPWIDRALTNAARVQSLLQTP